MTESKELHEKVDKILQRVESMDNFMPWLIRPQAKEIREEIVLSLQKQGAVTKVFLEIDGEKTVSDIAKELGMKPPNVSREVTKLTNMGLVEQKSVGSTTIYQKTKIDKIIGLTKALQKSFGSISNGKQTRDRNNNSV